jgi:hypothetical protein
MVFKMVKCSFTDSVILEKVAMKNLAKKMKFTLIVE